MSRRLIADQALGMIAGEPKTSTSELVWAWTNWPDTLSRLSNPLC